MPPKHASFAMLGLHPFHSLINTTCHNLDINVTIPVTKKLKFRVNGITCSWMAIHTEWCMSLSLVRCSRLCSTVGLGRRRRWMRWSGTFWALQMPFHSVSGYYSEYRYCILCLKKKSSYATLKSIITENNEISLPTTLKRSYVYFCLLSRWLGSQGSLCNQF